MVLWDTEDYPDYQIFLAVAQKCGVHLVLFAAREFDTDDIEDLTAQLEDCELTREERRDYESRLRDLRNHSGVTCSLELAFSYDSRLYVYEVQPDWYDDFCDHRGRGHGAHGRRRDTTRAIPSADISRTTSRMLRWLIPDAGQGAALRARPGWRRSAGRQGPVPPRRLRRRIHPPLPSPFARRSS